MSCGTGVSLCLARAYDSTFGQWSAILAALADCVAPIQGMEAKAMCARQFTSPLIIRGSTIVELHRDLGLQRDEAWYQEMLFRHPSLIPVQDLEPAFGRLVPVASELPTNRGSIDLLYADVDGHLVIVETKLFRNPEARRAVLGQILDYASDLATWSYSDLVDAVQSATSRSDKDPLASILKEAAMQNGDHFDESTFVEAVQENLERGRFLLLIIGDEISDSVREMTEYVQRAPILGYRLALVEIGLFSIGEGADEILVQPRIVAATKEVTRAIIEFKVPLKRTDWQLHDVSGKERGSTGRGVARTSISEQEYFAKLKGACGQEVSDLVGMVLRNAPAHSLNVVWMKHGPILKYTFEHEDAEDDLNFGQLSPDGTLAYTNWLSAKCNRLDLPPEVWHPYYEALLELLPNSKIKTGSKANEPTYWYLADAKGDDPEITPLLKRMDAWFVAIDDAISRIDSALAAQ